MLTIPNKLSTHYAHTGHTSKLHTHTHINNVHVIFIYQTPHTIKHTLNMEHKDRHTHTHTHIYIYIYAQYTLLFVCI